MNHADRHAFKVGEHARDSFLTDKWIAVRYCNLSDELAAGAVDQISFHALTTRQQETRGHDHIDKACACQNETYRGEFKEAERDTCFFFVNVSGQKVGARTNECRHTGEDGRKAQGLHQF